LLTLQINVFLTFSEMLAEASKQPSWYFIVLKKKILSFSQNMILPKNVVIVSVVHFNKSFVAHTQHPNNVITVPTLFVFHIQAIFSFDQIITTKHE